MVAVPVERAHPPVAQRYRWLPPGPVAELGRIDVLAVDLTRRVAGAEIFGVETVAAELGDRLQHLGARVGALAAGVEGLPRPGPAGANRVLDREVGGDCVV